MSFTLNIETGNAEMSEPSHVAEALTEVAEGIRGFGERDGKILDINGNVVGNWTLDLPAENEPLDAWETAQVEAWMESTEEERDAQEVEYPGLDLIDRYETERRED